MDTINRQERRKVGGTKEPVYTLTRSQIQQIKRDATNEAIDTAFLLMLGIPAMIIHDKYSALMKKEGRVNRFVELALDLYDSFNRGYVTLDDLQATLESESGLIIEDMFKNRRY